MYENQLPSTPEEKAAWVADLEAKIAFVDRQLHHQDLRLCSDKCADMMVLENYLAKEVLEAVRKTLVGKLVALNKPGS